MIDKLSKERRSENMRRIKSKSMKPEMLVRSLLHKHGYRFRLHRKDLPGKPDIVFPSRRKVIFVHGCFWHSHSDPTCVDGRRQPKSNLDYWLPKLQRNKNRDEIIQADLEAVGWSIMTVWECEINKPELVGRLRQFLSQ